jgi:hypothetical protein
MIMNHPSEEPKKIGKLRTRYNQAKQNLQENETIKSVQDHLNANKSAYIVGVIGTVAYVSKSRPLKINLTVSPTISPAIAPVFNNTPVFNNINTVAKNIGRPPYLVYIEELEKFVRSQGEAAKAIGVTDGKVSQYFNKGYENVNGYHLLRYKELT